MTSFVPSTLNLKKISCKSTNKKFLALLCVSSKGSDETACLCRLVWAFAALIWAVLYKVPAYHLWSFSGIWSAERSMK